MFKVWYHPKIFFFFCNLIFDYLGLPPGIRDKRISCAPHFYSVYVLYVVHTQYRTSTTFKICDKTKLLRSPSWYCSLINFRNGGVNVMRGSARRCDSSPGRCEFCEKCLILEEKHKITFRYISFFWKLSEISVQGHVLLLFWWPVVIGVAVPELLW